MLEMCGEPSRFSLRAKLEKKKFFCFPFFPPLLFHLSLTERNTCFYYFNLACMVPRLHPTVLHDPFQPLVITRQNSQWHDRDVEGFEHFLLHVHTTVTSGADRDKIEFRLFNSSSIRIKQPKLNLVTVGRDSSFPYYYTRALARQDTPLNRHSDSGSGPSRSTMTCRLLNLLFHGHTKLGYTDYLYTQAVAHQDPPLSRHLDPGNCPPINCDMGILQFLTPWSHPGSCPPRPSVI